MGNLQDLKNAGALQANLMAELSDAYANTKASFKSQSGKAYDTWKPKKNETAKIRLLEPVGGMGKYHAMVTAQHWLKDGNKNVKWTHNLEGKDGVYYCPEHTHLPGAESLPCPFTVLYQLAAQEGNKKVMGWYKHTYRFFANVVLRNSNGSIEGPFIWDMPVTVYNGIQKFLTNPEWGFLLNTKGYDFVIKRIDKPGEFVEYGVEASPLSIGTPVVKDPKELEALEKRCVDLSPVFLTDNPEDDAKLMVGKYIKVYPYDRLIDHAGLREYFDELAKTDAFDNVASVDYGAKADALFK